MSNFLSAVEATAVTLWVGGLWAIGYLAAPLLFATIPDRVLAGAVAGRLFAGIAWTGIACGTALLALRVFRLRGVVGDRQSWVIGAMLALALAGHFGVQPVLQRLKDDAAPAPVMESHNRDAFGRWHAVSSSVYLVESLLGLALVVLRGRRVS
ncbi:MAG TPA: DUF4149 domain-containing protein [Burkholderiales bacterium]